MFARTVPDAFGMTPRGSSLEDSPAHERVQGEPRTMPSASSTPAFPGPGRLERVVVTRYGRVMRTQPRESWMVPLLAVPLSEIALSGTLSDEDLVRFGAPPYLEGGPRALAGRARMLIDSVIEAGHRLT